ncbi:Ig domain-containing protein [Diaphorobacter aerolatus]|uniref:Putative Ig domain-containing protein n=1 Tax=Diaphorobacter aerolatus TaxID=1288495 RepID=A0A7H0GNH9_9BURK|nr:Ig domain-containing protein [Diaphorobacter aerolatus]QNP49845.1 putative Ig domain-containing protein [Diaphorobacter aerolatus]
MKNILRLSSLLAIATLAACGGGGGSGGTSAQQYSIELRTEKSSLPLNINPGQNGAGIGAYANYTTTLYVSAKTGGMVVPDKIGAFSCNLVQGLDSGALYYLDGKSEHETDVNGIKTPTAYRSITLDSNSGSASFHFHAGEKVGTAQIRCTVVDPRDGKSYSSDVSITVGAATGKAAWITGRAQADTTLGTSTNVINLPTSVAVQANVFDDANQAIANPSAANLQVSIRPTTAAASGAKLAWGSQVGGVVQMATSGGIGTFALRSGAEAGPILLEFVTDRSDNNIANGIQDPVSSLLVVNAVEQIASSMPLTIATTTIPDATLAAPYSLVLEATGGNAPYTWSVTGALPPGLTLNSAGLITGVPSANVTGSYNFSLRVTDSLGKTVSQNVTMTVGGSPTFTPLNITLSGCSIESGASCALPSATSGLPYIYAFSATGGDSTAPIVWSVQPSNWLTMGTSGNTGVLAGTPASPTAKDPGVACAPYGYVVTATRGNLVSSRRVTVTVRDCPAIVPETPEGTDPVTIGR